jgi:outer membrane protein assembly factor BamB
MMTRRLGGRLVLALAVVIGTGCAAIDAINPFSSSEPKLKPTTLAPIVSTSDLRVRWQANLGNAGEFSFTPAVVGNSVYAAARDGTVARIDNGSTIWRISAGQVLSGGVGSDGQRVVVGTPKGDVLAFDASNGKEIWRARASSEILAAPAVSAGLVVVRSGDSRIFGFEPNDGKRRWVYQRSTPPLSLRSAVGVFLAGDVTLAGFPGGKLVAIANNNGAAVWEVSVALPKGSTELERIADVTSNPVVSGSVVCAAAFQGRVSCVDTANGSVLWSREMSSSAGVDIDNRYVYATDDKGAVHALDRITGASVWRQDKLGLRTVSRPLVVGNQVAVADYQGFVHLLRRDDGAFAARLATDGSAVRANLIPSGEGFLVQTANGGVFALDTR